MSNMKDTASKRTITPSSSNQSYSAPGFLNAFAPPVPPLPSKVKRHVSITSEDADVFTSPSGSSDMQKPLPQIRKRSKDPEPEPEQHSLDESLVMVYQPQSRSPSPTTTVTHETVKPLSASRRKRRSMSVSDAELKKTMAASFGTTTFNPPRLSREEKRSEDSTGWASTLSGIITDLKGELDQLDPISASLDLRDPSTPGRRPPSRSKSDNAATITKASQRPPARTSMSTPTEVEQRTPTVTLQAASGVEESLLASGTSGRSRSGSANSAQPRVSGLRYGPRSPSISRGVSHLASPSRDTNRLRIQHRSTASSSEPSLIPTRDDGRVHSTIGAASQQDLTTNGLALSRIVSSHSPARNDESRDINTRGKELAAKCWAEDEEFLAKDKIAEWLGGQSPINKVALRHYMDNFDFSGLRLDIAFRRLCAKLFLKAETQQVDRILDEFGRRYWDCNPTSIFGSASVVHAVSYSLLLLNTDLHVADLSSRMSRGQFVRNTITAIQMQLQPIATRSGSATDVSPDDWSSLRGGSDGSDPPAPVFTKRVKRSDSMTSWSSVTRDGLSSMFMQASSGQLSTTPSDTPAQTSGRQTPLNSSRVSVISSGQESRVNEGSTPTFAYDRNWEQEMESLLKEIYAAVKNQQILQPISAARLSMSSLSPHNAVLRSRSLRAQPDRLTTLKRGSIRGLQSILTAQTGYSPYSSNSSFDGRASPAPSFATSHEGLHGSSVSFLTPALGFASNLSHTIIRETQEDDTHSMKSDQSLSTDISISDEELALLGPPWAKEGMLCRKQYWESTGKRAKSRAWIDVFVVIQKGELSMFVFGDHASGGGGIVGGGNWLENADPMGSVQLAHSLAHSLPPPGYNRQRPHCMVLTLSNGAVYFFQAGTEELVNEWVSTCNYWAARQSREPLSGGVSNMEYGWNRVLDPVTRTRSISEDNYSRDDDSCSVRSGRSRFGKKEFAATVRTDKSPWQDRTFINDWKPPMPPSVASTHDEEAQLEALRKHVTFLKTELQEHNELRTPMMKLYAPRSANAAKATANWEKKSQYLLTEIVKYESYIDSLQAAMSLRLKKRGEKALERALVVASPTSDDEPVGKGKWRGHPEEETIEESEEPPPTAPLDGSPDHRHFHRREIAEIDGSDDETDDDR
ncbi:unnamed protein product [Somion occarium]|uniref:SEC7 domain-containing protein n=1 Tax=Somion occarium TaxID=3059160 RepID=A0ABP1DGY9_9APHY